MEPSLRYPLNRNSFFSDQIEPATPIGGGIVLWRGYFQSLRPAIDRILINVDTAVGVMYMPGRLIELALQVIGRSTPNSLAPQHGFQERERSKLQQFISGMKITTPHHAQNPERRRIIRRVTQESARDRTFDIGDGQTMTVLEYFRDELNIILQFPDLVCVEVCQTFFVCCRA
jgi:eukaryotic translation initiation factor 2C